MKVVVAIQLIFKVQLFLILGYRGHMDDNY